MLYNHINIKIKKEGRDVESDNKVLKWFVKEHLNACENDDQKLKDEYLAFLQHIKNLPKKKKSKR
jgi:hypothetical protein